jgi:hypothetical protein
MNRLFETIPEEDIIVLDHYAMDFTYLISFSHEKINYVKAKKL